MVKTYGQIYLAARKSLLETEDEPFASSLARNLVCYYGKKTPAEYVACRELFASESIENDVNQAVARLKNGEPLAYVLGEWDFYGLTLKVNPSVLIPRDDSCAVVELALEAVASMPKKPRILDLCTGSGCIGIAMAMHLPNAKVTLADISSDALTVAKENVTLHKLNARVSCVHADALAAPPSFLGIYDMVISNPPYITSREMTELPNSVAAYEPHLALFGGEDGLDFYRNIAERYSQVLKPEGLMCFEFGMGQGDDICRILEQNGFEVLQRKKDFNDRERAVIARYTRKDD